MKIPLKAWLALSFALAALPAGSFALAASTEADFKQASTAANAAEAEAGRLRNRWLATEAALAEAKQAAEKGDFDRATAAAKQAEALAKASIFQVESEKQAWKNLEIR